MCDSQGRILGVLDLSSQAGGIRPDALALVRAAVDQIEHRLFAQARARHRAAPACRSGRAGAPGEALLAFRGDLLVGANRLALRALELSATALGVYRHEDLFEDALTHAPDATGRVQARNGAVYHARLSLPPSPAPRVVPAPERSQPRAVAPAPAAVSLDAAALDAGSICAPDGCRRLHSAAGRNRRGQGSVRAPDACAQPARRRAVRGGELRGAA